MHRSQDDRELTRAGLLIPSHIAHMQAQRARIQHAVCPWWRLAQIKPNDSGKSSARRKPVRSPCLFAGEGCTRRAKV